MVKIQGLFKAFECFSSTLQGKFEFQGLFKTVLYIQVLFKPVRTLFSKHYKTSWPGSSFPSTTKPADQDPVNVSTYICKTLAMVLLSLNFDLCLELVLLKHAYQTPWGFLGQQTKSYHFFPKNFGNGTVVIKLWPMFRACAVETCLPITLRLPRTTRPNSALDLRRGCISVCEQSICKVQI